ncbi:MAG: division/cell wall cluster transcriptional repressor MraZ [Oscillospiraceae bacterium]|nr:division/cell wall cluster transcriptional repressor MraZ [Oscillospiraceae bacterium]
MTGTYEHSLDNAGRLIVPSKLREKLGTRFYLAVGVKENLTLYPMAAWEKLQERVSQLTTSQAAAMDVFFASAQLCEADKQWRFQVPGYLKEYAGIDRDVVITGNNDRAQIWSADKWNEKKRKELNPATVAGLMEALGI